MAIACGAPLALVRQGLSRVCRDLWSEEYPPVRGKSNNFLSKFCRVLSVEPDDQPGVVRIGELSRRVGVSDHVLRAWETRYGLLTPERSPGGFRLYSDSDEHRVRRMQFHLAHGLSAAEAARTAIAEAQTRARVERASRSGPTGRSAPTCTSSHVRCSVRSTTSTKALRRRCSTVCCRTSHWRRPCATSWCRTCISSASDGSGVRSASPRSTSRAT